MAFFIRAVHMSTQTKAEVDVLMQRVRATGSKPWVASGDARFLVAQYACLGPSQPRLPPPGIDNIIPSLKPIVSS